MKRLLAVGAVAAIALGALVVPAGAKGKKQTVEGTILAPARHPDGCYTGLSRHLWSLAGDASNGLLGWTFDVEKATWNKPFKLDSSGGAGPTTDLDITFYLGDFATTEEWINEPAPGAPASVAFATHDGPGEKGKVPPFSVKAIVCIYASEAGAAVGVPFTYTAGK